MVLPPLIFPARISTDVDFPAPEVPIKRADFIRESSAGLRQATTKFEVINSGKRRLNYAKLEFYIQRRYQVRPKPTAFYRSEWYLRLRWDKDRALPTRDRVIDLLVLGEFGKEGDPKRRQGSGDQSQYLLTRSSWLLVMAISCPKLDIS